MNLYRLSRKDYAKSCMLHSISPMVIQYWNIMIKYFLTDMCLDDEIETDEIKPNKLQLLSPRSRDTEHRRVQAMSRSQHLAMVLDGQSCFFLINHHLSVQKIMQI